MIAWSTSFSNDLAERWDDYVDCRRRLKKEGPFLRKILQNCKLPILDAAMALGCEAVFLSKVGFDVIGNEVDHRLRRHAELSAIEAGVRLQISAVDWRDLDRYFAPNSLGAALIIGNSLGLLASPADRRAVCSKIFNILAPGGVFVVDQRNYNYMLSDAVNVLAGNFRYSGEIMYCERSVVGRPTIIEPDRVRLTCFDRYTGRRLGYFDVHPFSEGDLVGLVRSCGFCAVDEYYDFDAKRREHWDFMTLVCKKGQ